MSDFKTLIARRVAKEFKDGDVVNLGIGLPTLVADYIPDDIDVTLYSDNGCLGLGGAAAEGDIDPYLIDAGGTFATVGKNCAFFDSALSFAIARGGHLDVCVLGALQVDSDGNIANWCVPGKKIPGMGGAMDLVVGSKRVIIAMEHTLRGQPKLMEKCTLPLTAINAVNRIVTQMGVIDVTENGFLLVEYNPEYTVEEIKAATAAPLAVSPDLKPMI